MAVDVAGRDGCGRSVGVGARVDGVQSLLGSGRLELAAAVVGQRVIDLAGLRVDGGPFGPIHPGGADRIGGQPGIDQHVGLVGELVAGGCDRRIAQRQLDPLAGAVGGEFRHVQLAAVQIFIAGGDAVGRAGIGRIPVGSGHELVHVLAARVVAHVDGQRLARDQLGVAGAFVREPAERRALSDRHVPVVGVDLDDVAEGVELVAVVVGAVGGTAALADVEAVVLVGAAGGFPAMAAGGSLCATVAQQRDDTLGGRAAAGSVVACDPGEVAVPVFFGRQESAPRRVAGAAVVDGAAGVVAGGGELGLHQGVAAHRAVDLDRGQRRHTPVERRAALVGELAGDLAHFDDRHPVGRNLLVRFGSWARVGGGAVGMQELVGQGLVVHCQQAALGPGDVACRPGCVQAEILDAVVVVAGAVIEVGVGAVVLVSRGGRRQRVAQGEDRRGRVASRDGDDVGQVLGDRRKTQAQWLWSDRGWGHRCGSCRNRRVVAAAAAGGQRQGAQHGGPGGAHAHAQDVAARQPGVQDVVQGRVAAGVEVFGVVAGVRIHSFLPLSLGSCTTRSLEMLCDAAMKSG